MRGARVVQNFRGQRGVLWGGAGTSVDILEASLARLGMTLARPAEIDPQDIDAHRDVLLIDGDSPLDATMEGPSGSLLSLAPAIGLVGVEAPSRLKALMDLGVTAFLRKPVHAAAVYAALFLAVNSYNRLRALELDLVEHELRRRGRRAVLKAVVRLMQTTGIDDDEAYAELRRESMRRRMSIEACAAELVAGASSSSADLKTPDLKKWA